MSETFKSLDGKKEFTVENEKSLRQGLLEEAIELTTKARNNTYGPPTQDFDRIAAMWNIIFEPLLKEGEAFDGHHVAMAMNALKLSRLVWSPGHRDNWVDIAGYAACGWECAYKSENVP